MREPPQRGRVHQFWEQSQDAGNRWTVGFDGTYVPCPEDTATPAPATST